MGNNSNFGNTADALFTGLNEILSTKTVVGEPQTIGDTVIVPLVDVSFGMGAGAFSRKDSKEGNGAGGVGGKMTPSAILVIKDGQTRLVNIRNQEAITKILDMVPDSVNAVTSFVKNRGKSNPEAEQVEEAIYREMKAEEVRTDE